MNIFSLYQKFLFSVRRIWIVFKLFFFVGFHYLFVRVLIPFLWITLNCGTCHDFLLQESCEANYLSNLIQNTLKKLY